MEQYYMVYSRNCEPYFGKIKERKGDEVTMTDVCKIWDCQGICCLEDIAVDGVSFRSHFSKISSEMIIFGVNLIIPCTEKATQILLDLSKRVYIPRNDKS